MEKCRNTEFRLDSSKEKLFQIYDLEPDAKTVQHIQQMESAGWDLVEVSPQGSFYGFRVHEGLRASYGDENVYHCQFNATRNGIQKTVNLYFLRKR